MFLTVKWLKQLRIQVQWENNPRFNTQLVNPNFEASGEQEKSAYNFLAETWTEVSFQKSHL